MYLTSAMCRQPEDGAIPESVTGGESPRISARNSLDPINFVQPHKMKTVTHVYSDHEKKYLNENLLWGCTKFIGSKEFRSEMRGLSPPVTDSGMAPSSG